MQRGLAQALSSAAGSVETQQKRSGENLSPFRGSGLDYEESRPYQSGDDLRHINWRLMARAGDLYTKVFREERETSRVIVIDRRSAMRFGTRANLKVTRAVQIAAYLAGVSLRQGYSVGGVLMQPEIIWVEPQRSKTRVHDWLFNATEHCEVLPNDPSEPGLSQLLSLLHLKLVSGSQIILISDFHDLHESHKALLSQIRQSHQLLAVQVLDPAEETLPDAGIWPINAYANENYVTLHAGDAFMQEAYARQAREEYQALQGLLSALQIPLVSARTNQAFDDVVKDLVYV